MNTGGGKRSKRMGAAVRVKRIGIAVVKRNVLG
jgi:hypothetical protein